MIHNYNNCYHNNVDKALNDNYWIDFWLDNADFYDTNNMNHIIYFNNYNELIYLTNTVNFDYISNCMKTHNAKRIINAEIKWKEIIDNLFFKN